MGHLESNNSNVPPSARSSSSGVRGEERKFMTLPITFFPSTSAVKIHRQYDCEYCEDTREIETLDSDYQPSGYYKPCFNCGEEDHDPDASN